MQSLPSYLELPAHLGPVERFLVRLDDFPLGMLFRVAVGYAVLPLWQLVAGTGAKGWYVSLWFLAVLVMVRLLPTLLRKLLRFPSGAEAVWRYRRWLAKRFDSYQWRKLLSFGIGMLAYVAISQRFDSWAIALTVASLAAGCLGEWGWRVSGGSRSVTPR